MDKVIASFSFNELDPESVVETDRLAAFQQKKEEAVRNISSVVQSVQGRIVGWIGENLIIEVDVDESKVIRDLHDRLNDELHFINSVGVGETVDQAVAAAKEAKLDHSVRVWHPDMDQDEEIHPKTVAIGEETIPVQKNEEEAQELAKEEPMAESDKDIPSDDSVRQIAVIIKTLKENREYLENLKQANPEAYQAITEIVQALAEVSSKSKEKASKKKEDDAKKIFKLIQATHNGELDEQEKRLIESLLEEQETREKEQAESRQKSFAEAHKTYKEKSRKERSHAKNLKVLFKLRDKAGNE